MDQSHLPGPRGRSLPLPACPSAWLGFCTSRELAAGPVARRVAGRQLVAFRTESGRVAVLDGRCVHMGSNLARGQVVGESIRCPFHHWQFAGDGRCTHIPATAEIPAFACQRSYVAQEQHGCVFFYWDGEPAYPLPFFDNADADQLVRAPAFTLDLDCPWYMVGANGIDVQHFQATHSRRLLDAPRIEHPQVGAHRSTARFEVAGTSVWDRLTRQLAGPEVTMRVTDWGGTLFFVEATFRRTTTFGMVTLLPVERTRTLLYVTVAIAKSGSGRVRLTDRAAALIRRLFIRKFLAADIDRSQGIDLRPDTLIDADRWLKDYYSWLCSLYPPTPAAAP